MSLSRQLVELLLAKQAGGIVPDIVTKTRLHIADAIGIALAARHGLPIAEQVIAGLDAGGSVGRCGVIGGHRGMPPTAAAFANAALIHALDFDDIHDIARLHPTTVTLPAALAAAELAGAGSAAIVDAVCLGNELMCRLGVMWSPSGAGPGADWFLTQLFGYFGACMSAATVLGLSADAIVSAMGLAYMQAAGGKEPGYGVGATARSIYPAFAAQGGVQSVLLARAGVVGPATALDGLAGLFRLYLGTVPSAAQIAFLLAPAGWVWGDTEAKPWPSCRLSHPYIAAALAVRPQIGARQIARIIVAVNASAGKLCQPLEQRRRPTTLQDAKYSVPFMTAFALAHGAVDLPILGPDAYSDPAALALVDRVEIRETLPDNPGHPPAEIIVETGDGAFLSPKQLRFDMAADAVHQKFLSCLAYGGLAAEAETRWDHLWAQDRPDILAAAMAPRAQQGARA